MTSEFEAAPRGAYTQRYHFKDVPQRQAAPKFPHLKARPGSPPPPAKIPGPLSRLRRAKDPTPPLPLPEAAAAAVGGGCRNMCQDASTAAMQDQIDRAMLRLKERLETQTQERAETTAKLYDRASEFERIVPTSQRSGPNIGLEDFDRVAVLWLRKQRECVNARDFDVLATAGEGSFGTVKLVTPTRASQSKFENKRVFALKIMNKTRFKKERAYKRAQLERDVLALTPIRNCPHIVKLHACFQDPHNLFMLFEYLPGGDFYNFLKKKRFMQETWVQFYMAEILLALEALHSLGFAHRDVKADNIAIASNGHAKLLDFGLCAEFGSRFMSGDSLDPVLDSQSSLKRLNSFVGTAHYMSPEVYLGSYGAAADLWSWGIVVFECLYGRLPFRSSRRYRGNPRAEMNHIGKKVCNFEKHLPAQIPDCVPVSENAQDLLFRRVLVAETSRASLPRLKEHPFFNEVQPLRRIHLLNPPYTPPILDVDGLRFQAIQAAAASPAPPNERVVTPDLRLLLPAASESPVDPNLVFPGYQYSATAADIFDRMHPLRD